MGILSIYSNATYTTEALREQGLGTNPGLPKSAQVYVSPAVKGGRWIQGAKSEEDEQGW